MADDGAAPPGTEPAASGNGNGNGMNGKARSTILLWLGLTLVIFAAGEVALGVGSWKAAAADPQGVNVVRDDAKTVILYILGVLSGALMPRNH